MMDASSIKGFMFIDINVGPGGVLCPSHFEVVILSCIGDDSSMPRASFMVDDSSIPRAVYMLDSSSM